MFDYQRVTQETDLHHPDPSSPHVQYSGPWSFDIQMRILLKYWGCPIIGVPQNGWILRENPIKKDDVGAPLF